MKLKILLTTVLIFIQSMSFARVIMILPNGAPSTPTSIVDFLRDESRNNEDKESLTMTYRNTFTDSYFTNKTLHTSRHKAITHNLSKIWKKCMTLA